MGFTVPALTAVLAALIAFYQFHFHGLLADAGVQCQLTSGKARFGCHFRPIEKANNDKCISVNELEACEKLVLHPPSGVIYAACSTMESRTYWTPAIDRFNASMRSLEDYVATYDPTTGTVQRFTLEGFERGLERDGPNGFANRGLSVHGMDVVPDVNDANKLWVYLVNHRPLIGGFAGQEADAGAFSSIEVFHTSVPGMGKASHTLTWVRTVEDATIITPNDITGLADGSGFWFTNDNGRRTGNTRAAARLFGLARSSVGFCHIDRGCKIAIGKMLGNNGITRAGNGTFYVGNAVRGELRVLEVQDDDSLVLTDTIKTDRPMDNLMLDEDGFVWAAAFPRAVTTGFLHFNDPIKNNAPMSVFRFGANTGKSIYFGEKFKVHKPFEDDGEIVSGTTSAVYDSRRGKLFLNGLMSPCLSVCELSGAQIDATALV